MRKAMISAMKYWITEYDIDGFRCDLAFWVELDFWKQARAELDMVKPLFWLGEFDELENPAYGEVFDASYTWKWMHLAKEFYQSKLPVDTLFSLLKSYDNLGDSTMRSWFTANHDENSWNGTEFEKYGNMAKSLAAFSLTWNGVPLLYSGQELGNRKRLAFFEKDPIEKGKDAEELTSFYQTLLRLKHSNSALRAGDPTVATYRIKTSADDKVFCYLRKRGEQEVLVVLNWSGEKDFHFEILDERVKGIYRNVFSKAANDFTTAKYFEMQPWEFLVYEK
jgi:glycosidase